MLQSELTPLPPSSVLAKDEHRQANRFYWGARNEKGTPEREEVGPDLLNHITLDGHAAAGAARQRRLRWEPVSASTISAIESAEPRQPVLHAHRQTRARRRKRPRPAPL
jgi:hypothetical protein